MSTSVDSAREQEVLARLRTVQDPDLKKDFVSLGMIKDLKVDGDRVRFTLVLTTPAHPLKEEFREACPASATVMCRACDAAVMPSS